MPDDRRLIEDYLPIEAISVEASGEPRTKGHLSTLHIWRARRPLVACRAAVYSALVPDSGKRAESAEFVARLSRYPGDPGVIQAAQRKVLDAHSRRLADTDSFADLQRAGDAAVRPKVLDPFAGGGAIPLEAARLGCDSFAIDLNPVAHLIQLCTAQFPQEFGTDLADDVERWADWVLSRVKPSVSSVYPKISIPARLLDGQSRIAQAATDTERELSVVAYYWTRTVPCPKPACGGTVPLYRQTWLRKKPSGFVALRPKPDIKRKKVFFEVVEASSEKALGFDPSEGSKGSATICPFCTTAVTAPYVRAYGDSTGFGQQLMCIIGLNPFGTGKLYEIDDALIVGEEQRQADAEAQARVLENDLDASSLDADVPPTGNAGLATGNSYLYGIKTFRQAFSPRQRFVLLKFASEIRSAYGQMIAHGVQEERARAITTYLGVWLSRLTDRFNNLARWHNTGEKIEGLSSMKRFAMTWDYPEVNLFGGGSGDASSLLSYITAVIRKEGRFRNPATCIRASATSLPFPDGMFDGVITDPPYYDNESYSELSDVCYVWLKAAVGFLYPEHPEHFAGQLTPKRQECVAAAYRQGGTSAAKEFYEECLLESLRQAFRVLNSGGVLVLMYAHKTTAGWSTLINAIRRAGFEVREAWPIETETKSRVAHAGDAALASSILLTARKRSATEVGCYEDEVKPLLERIVAERVDTFWALGISGADLVIASVGAGLQAFTKYPSVEFINGDEVPAETFLTEVETAVLGEILNKLSERAGVKGTRHDLAGLDPSSRFYIFSGATPTAQPSRSPGRRSSSPTVRTSSWTARTASPRTRARSSRRSPASTA